MACNFLFKAGQAIICLFVLIVTLFISYFFWYSGSRWCFPDASIWNTCGMRRLRKFSIEYYWLRHVFKICSFFLLQLSFSGPASVGYFVFVITSFISYFRCSGSRSWLADASIWHTCGMQWPRKFSTHYLWSYAFILKSLNHIVHPLGQVKLLLFLCRICVVLANSSWSNRPPMFHLGSMGQPQILL